MIRIHLLLVSFAIVAMQAVSSHAASEPQPASAANAASLEEDAVVPLVDDGDDDEPQTLERAAPRATDLTTPSSDVWERVRRGFAMPDLRGDLVTQHQAWYGNRPAYVQRMLNRSKLYLHYIVEQVEQRNMPTELALLPFVESAFNPMAYSSARASGIWQFISSTARNYKLKQNNWYDGRRDIVASTKAALDYLEYLYNMHGDWYLALASYNWGEGAVSRAMAKNRARGLPTDYASLKMPNEPRNYVPKLQAIKNLIAQPDLFSIELPALPDQPYFATVAKPRDMDVSAAARLAEMPMDDFIALNPAHRHVVGPGASTLVLPADKVDVFQSNIEEHDGAPLVSWKTHTLRPGDRLKQIAQRYGISVGRLKTINNLGPKPRLHAGQTLLVPLGTPTMNAAAAPETTAADEPALRKASVGTSGRSHKVRRGESLARIAKRYGVRVEDLRNANGGLARLRVGQRLAVPGAPPGKQVQMAASHRSTSAKRSVRSTTYTVKRGDTLDSIAKRFQVARGDLQRWNKMQRKTPLRAGKQVTIVVARND